MRRLSPLLRVRTLRSHLAVLTLVTLVPLMLFAVIAAALFVRHERATFQRGATETTLALMTAVDAEIKGSITALEALAASPHLGADTLEKFHAEAARVLRTQPKWLTINLAPPSGQQIVNVILPFGADLPVIAERASFDRVVQTRRPAVSSLVRGQITGPLDFAVRVPVTDDGRTKYVLSAVVRLDTISALLAAQRLPRTWVGEVLDGDHQIVARTVQPERTLGRLASDSLRAALAGSPEGWLRGRTLEGVEVYIPYHRSTFSDWTVALSVPASVVEAPAVAMTWAMGTGITAGAIIALLLALGFGRRIAAPIVSLAGAARAIGRGEAYAIDRHARIEEVRELSRTLDEAAAAIRSREQTQGYLAAIVETSRDAIMSFGVDGTILSWNSAATRLFGHAADAIVGQHVAALFPVTQADDVAALLAAASRGQSLPALEMVAARKSGAPVDVAVTVSPIRDPSGRVTGVSAIMRDVSEAKRVERALRESEERLATLAEAMPQLVWTADSKGYVDYVNRRWYDYTGATPSETFGDGWVSAVHPDERPRVVAGWQEAIERGEPTELEYRLRTADGRYEWFLTRSVPYRDADGAIVKWFGTSTNIEGQKRAEERLRATDRAKDEFLAMLGHELRNPLGAIAGAVRVLDAAGPHDDALARATAVVGRQVEHLSRLVDDLLDVSRVTTGKVVLTKEPVDLAEVVAHTIGTWRAAGRLDRHRVSLDTVPVWVFADTTRLEQIVANLLGNALKYTPDDGDVTVAVTRDGGTAVLRVADTGVGIPPYLIERVFDLFAQGDHGLDRGRGGLGIGLTLVRRLVEMHDGRVTALSDGPGRGSVFTVTLPAIDAPVPVPAAAPASAGPAPVRSRRILVVEDNDDAREMLGVVLTLGGHEVHEAADGMAGLEMASTVRPDVVLIDVGLPRLDGYELARRLRAANDRASMRLVAITGYGQAEDRQRALDAGFDAHVTKPVVPERLAELIDPDVAG
jgi:PAS domain S-box-containing protein